jgi:hypothetical protein
MLVGIFHQETYLWARLSLLQMTTLHGLHHASGDFAFGFQQVDEAGFNKIHERTIV